MLPILLGNNLAMPIPERAALGLALAILVPVCYGLYHNLSLDSGQAARMVGN